MKYAVIKTGGKQYRVSEGQSLLVERLPLEQDKEMNFPEVLLYVADGVLTLGNPFIEGMTVKGKIVAHPRGEKIRVSKFKSKVRYRRHTGHRQELTKVQIEKIDLSAKKTSAKKVKS